GRRGTVEKPLAGHTQGVLDILNQVPVIGDETVRSKVIGLGSGCAREIDNVIGSVHAAQAQLGNRILLEVDEFDITGNVAIARRLITVIARSGREVFPRGADRVRGCVLESVETFPAAAGKVFAAVGVGRVRGRGRAL